MRRPTLFLMVGLPGSGKTTRARDLAREHSAVRFSPDEWMKPLFGSSDVDGRRDILEGRLIWTASQVLLLGGSAILDFGFWGRDERAALHWFASEHGAATRTMYTNADTETLLDRVNRRWRDDPGATWVMDADSFTEWRAAFQEPAEDELDGTWRPLPPPGFETWRSWMSDRWPTSVPQPAR
ncbi:ATP-binding protein [Leifsonia shinshuensis]|uniref:AAA family ATPase n=1 Tax=Leifsonia shinshuensis TaxID=150026 RepID=UPI001F510576|nr:ATP-binding protein [Leifsonia shinshuensis]MCI0155728.1 ATP-binding protein [Leifsonia shinshuensis]